MFEASMPLAFRARYARLKRSSVGWWRDSLASADKDVHKRAFWVALVLGWTAPRVFDELLPDVDDVVDGLPSEYLARVESLLVSTARETDERIDRRGHVPRLELMSDRLVWMTILGFRLGPADVSREVKRRNSEFLTAWYSDQVRTLELRNYPKPDASDTVFRNWLKKVRMAQASECSLPREAVDRFRDGAYSAKLASQIVREPGDFPRDSVIRAHAVVMGEYGPPTLTSVAKQQEWSFHD